VQDTLLRYFERCDHLKEPICKLIPLNKSENPPEHDHQSVSRQANGIGEYCRSKTDRSTIDSFGKSSYEMPTHPETDISRIKNLYY